MCERPEKGRRGTPTPSPAEAKNPPERTSRSGITVIRLVLPGMGTYGVRAHVQNDTILCAISGLFHGGSVRCVAVCVMCKFAGEMCKIGVCACARLSVRKPGPGATAPEARNGEVGGSGGTGMEATGPSQGEGENPLRSRSRSRREQSPSTGWREVCHEMRASRGNSHR
jgi:hypothetical protein